MNTYEYAKKEKEFLEQIIEKKKDEYRKMPNGRLECHKRDNGGWRWFLIKNNERRQLSHKNEKDLASKMAYKRILKSDINLTKSKLDNLKKFIEYGNPDCLLSPSDKRARNNEEIKRLANSYASVDDVKISNWKNNVKGSDDYMMEGRVVPSKSGLMVRSKSEGIIDGALYDHGLQYLYEPQIYLKEAFVGSYSRVIHPDFGIWSNKLDAPIYWEHFGLLDNEKYMRKTIGKLNMYILNGYFPMENLIITSEREDRIVDARWVEMLIEYYFD